MDAKAYRKAIDDYHLYARENAGNELTHWGITGMKWGRRRWQNEDGSLTEAGRTHYGVGDARKEAKNKAAIADIKNKQTMKQKERLAKIERRNELTAAKADAIRIKAQQEAQIKEAEAETEQRKISAKVDKQAEKNRHAEEGLGRKLLIGAGIVAGAAIIIKLRNQSAESVVSNVSPTAAKKASNTVKKVSKKPAKQLTQAAATAAATATATPSATPAASPAAAKSTISNLTHLKNLLYNGAVKANVKARNLGLIHGDVENVRVVRIPKQGE